MVALLLIGSSLYFFSLRPSPSPQGDLAAYVADEAGLAFTSDAGGYRVVFPTSPRAYDLPTEGDGSPDALHVQESDVGSGSIISVGHGELPGPLTAAAVDPLLDDLANFLAFPEEGGSALSIDRLEHAGNPALDVVAVGDDSTYEKYRIIIAQPRLYMLVVESPHRSTPGFDRLVDSFEILGNPAPA